METLGLLLELQIYTYAILVLIGGGNEILMIIGRGPWKRKTEQPQGF